MKSLRIRSQQKTDHNKCNFHFGLSNKLNPSQNWRSYRKPIFGQRSESAYNSACPNAAGHFVQNCLICIIIALSFARFTINGVAFEASTIHVHVHSGHMEWDRMHNVQRTHADITLKNGDGWLGQWLDFREPARRMRDEFDALPPFERGRCDRHSQNAFNGRARTHTGYE